MSIKALLIGDTHVYPYPNYNLFEEKDFRLNQFYKLMERLIEIGNDYNCEYLFNLGDFVHKPIMDPRTLAGVKTCFEILNKKWKQDKHWLIYGNHCINSKHSIIHPKDSPLYAFNSFYTYMDHKIVELGGKSLAFMNWNSDQDLSWIENPVDYFFGHITPYVEGALFGQEIDWSKFNIGFAGDYHQPKIFNGKLHTTNVPIPHYISDSQEGSVVVLDIETGEWERVPTRKEGSFNHLRIFYDDVSVKDEDDYTVRVKRPIPTVKSQHLHGSINLDEVIENVVKSAGVEELHTKIIPEVESNEEVLSLNFLLKSLKVKNFRSIEEFEMVFDNGLYCFTSGNGEGKSSLINSIAYCLNPPRSSKDLIRRGQEEMSVEIELEYQGLNHKILRSTSTKGSSVKYWINDEEIPVNNSSELNSKIQENLQFMQLWDILYRFQSAPYLLSGYSYAQRIDMVSKLLGLGKVKDIYQVAYSKLKEKKQENDSLIKQIEIDNAVLDSMEIVDPSTVLDIDLLESKKGELNNDLTACQSKLYEIQKNNQIVNELNRRVTELEILDSQLDKETDLTQIPVLIENIEKASSFIKKQEYEISEYERGIRISQDKKLTLQNEINLSESQLDTLRRSDRKCSACGRLFDNQEEFDKHIENEYQKHIQLEKINSEKIKVCQEVIDEVQPKLNECREQVESARSAVKSYESELQQLRLVEDQFKKFMERQDEFNKFLMNHPEINSNLSTQSEGEIQQSISDLKIEISRIENSMIETTRKLEIVQKRKSLEEKIVGLISESDRIGMEIVKIDEYCKLFHPTGDVIKSIFLQVAQNLTSGNFAVSTIRTLASGEERIDFDMKMMVDGGLIDYDSLSGGQKVMCDIFFLTRLFDMSGNVGLLMLDETLKDLDPNNLEEASKMIKSSPINTILLVTHSESFNNYDYKFNVRKENGCSIYQIEG